MLTEAFFTIAKIWKQPECPSVDKYIKMWCIHTMEYYSAFYDHMSDLEGSLLSEIRQSSII